MVNSPLASSETAYPCADQATLILLGFVDHNELDERDFVRRLHDWQQMGIKEVGGEVPAHNAIIPYSNGEVHSLVRLSLLITSPVSTTEEQTPWKLSELDPFADALRYVSPSLVDKAKCETWRCRYWKANARSAATNGNYLMLVCSSVDRRK